MSIIKINPQPYGIGRRPFTEKYSNIAEKLNLKQYETEINEKILAYQNKYEKELPLIESGEILLEKSFQDKRTEGKYFYDVLDGWNWEDIKKIWLQNRLSKIIPDVFVDLSGSDKDRVFETKKSYKITTNSDFSYNAYGHKVKLELQVSREIREVYHMKESKVDRAFREGIIFFWYIIRANNYFFCLPHRDLKDTIPVPNKSWGGKMAYNLLSNKVMHYSSRGDLSEDVYEILGLKK